MMEAGCRRRTVAKLGQGVVGGPLRGALFLTKSPKKSWF